MFKWIEEGVYGALCRAYTRFRRAMTSGELEADEPPAIETEVTPAKKPRGRKS